MSAVATSETTEQAPALRSTCDPRNGLGLSERDLAVLGWLAQLPWAAQYHVHTQFFAETSDVPVSRCARRLFRLGLVAIHRLNGVGLNLVRTTAAGREVAQQQCGVPENEIFASRWPSASALPHDLWLLDLAIAARGLWPTHTIYPCWRVRRLLAGTTVPVPDLLVVSRSRKRVIAFEVDLATENLKRVFLPKLATLRTELSAFGAEDAARGIIVLTSGERRAAALAAQLRDQMIPVITAVLPKPMGRATIGALRDLLNRL